MGRRYHLQIGFDLAHHVLCMTFLTDAPVSISTTTHVEETGHTRCRQVLHVVSCMEACQVMLVDVGSKVVQQWLEARPYGMS